MIDLDHSMVSSPAGAVFVGAVQCILDGQGGVVRTCVGIDGAPILPAPAGKFVGIECDLDQIGLGKSYLSDPAQYCLSELGDGWRHKVCADGAEPRVIALIRPQGRDHNDLSGVILVVGHASSPVLVGSHRMAEALGAGNGANATGGAVTANDFFGIAAARHAAEDSEASA